MTAERQATDEQPNAAPHALAGNPHVLVVEDDRDTRLLVARFLREGGLRVTAVRDGREMWETLENSTVDLILLDVMLPGATGLDLCRTIRQRSSVPIIMLTARGSETDRVVGLELGADDYIAKPFSPPELLARVRAVLRRSTGLMPVDEGRRTRRITFEKWALDIARRELLDPNGAVVDLSTAEFDLLLAFVEHPQRVLSRDQLLELSRQRVGDVFDRSIDVLVSRLRRKLEADPLQPGLIKTVRNMGYLFVPRPGRDGS